MKNRGAALVLGLGLLVSGPAADAWPWSLRFGILEQYQGKWLLHRETTAISRSYVQNDRRLNLGFLLRGSGTETFTLQHVVVAPPSPLADMSNPTPSDAAPTPSDTQTLTPASEKSWWYGVPIVVDEQAPLGRWKVQVYVNGSLWRTFEFDLSE